MLSKNSIKYFGWGSVIFKSVGNFDVIDDNLYIFVQERMYELERREAELALEEKKQLEAKRTLLQEAARKQDEPVDDSKLVEAMFDFLPDSSSEAPAPKDTSVFSDLPQQRADQQEVNILQLSYRTL